MTGPIREAAEFYAGLGWTPVPCVGKIPPGLGWDDRAIEARARGDFSAFREGVNVGLVLGEPSGDLFDFDPDCPEAIQAAPWFLPPTATYGRAGAPAAHRLYRSTGAARTKQFRGVDQKMICELRGNGGQTIVPPSVHERTGEIVTWYTLPKPTEIAYPDLLAGVSTVAGCSELARGWPKNGRHEAQLALAGGLLRGGLDPARASRIHACVLSVAGAHPKTEATIKSTLERLTRDEPIFSWPKLSGMIGAAIVKSARARLGIANDAIECTDVGNAARLVDHRGQDLRFVPGIGWLVWDGRRWKRDEARMIVEHAKASVRSIWTEASTAAALMTEAASERAKKLREHAHASQAGSRIEAMIKLAQSDPEIVTCVDAIDADPWCFNATNGTIDLRTGKMRAHDRGDAATKIGGCAFDPLAACPTFDAFLARCVPDPEVRTFLQRFAGYSLTANASEHCLSFLHGGGQNGKGTLLTALLGIMGDYAVKAPRGLLTASHSDRHPTELMVLRGARLVWCNEVNKGDVWDEAKVKDLASTDPITGRYMNKDFVTFTPTHKLWIAGNDKPTVRGTDDGIWRRLRLVPFEVRIPDSEKDTGLDAKIAAEFPGLLAWAVRGCLAWQQHGLGAPAAVVAATEAYRESEDALGRFLADRCEVGPGLSVTSTAIYSAFSGWFQGEGEQGKIPSVKDLSAELVKRGFVKGRTSTGARERSWGGLRIRGTTTEQEKRAN